MKFFVDRVIRLDVHPTGALWGKGESPSGEATWELERAIAGRWADYAAPLERQGLKQDRRALRMRIGELDWRWDEGGTLILSFTLPRGSYATAVLRELVLSELRSQPP